MLTGLKNFALNKILRHVAENRKLNAGTNVLSLGLLIYYVIDAALDANANWMLMFQCCSQPGSLHEIIRIAGTVIGAVVLWLCGKWGWLNQWMPTINQIIEEAEKQAESAKGAAAK